MNKTNFLAFLIARLRKTKKSKLSYNIETGRCFYSNKANGSKCFIGITLPQTAFTDEDLENHSAYDVLEKNRLMEEFNGDLRLFVSRVQYIHDGFSQTNPYRFDWKYMNEQFHKLCKESKIDFPSEELIESYKNVTPEKFWELENNAKS